MYVQSPLLAARLEWLKQNPQDPTVQKLELIINQFRWIEPHVKVGERRSHSYDYYELDIHTELGPKPNRRPRIEGEPTFIITAELRLAVEEVLSDKWCDFEWRSSGIYQPPGEWVGKAYATRLFATFKSDEAHGFSSSFGVAHR